VDVLDGHQCPVRKGAEELADRRQQPRTIHHPDRAETGRERVRQGAERTGIRQLVQQQGPRIDQPLDELDDRLQRDERIAVAVDCQHPPAVGARAFGEPA
jgi:hypothetical protein